MGKRKAVKPPGKCKVVKRVEDPISYELLKGMEQAGRPRDGTSKRRYIRAKVLSYDADTQCG